MAKAKRDQMLVSKISRKVIVCNNIAFVDFEDYYG